MKRMTQRALAKELEISERTMYRVINADPAVRQQTRARIVDALTRNGYYAHGNLQIRTILIDCSPERLYMQRCISDLTSQISELEFSIRYGSHLSNESVFYRDVEKSDAVIFFSKPSAAVLKKIKEVNPDIFSINVFGADGGDIGINPDNFRGGQIAARHLLDNGHRNVAVIAYRKSPGQLNRYKSFVAEYEYLAPGAVLTKFLTDGDDSVFRTLLEMRVRPSAVFCTGGQLGYRLCRSAQIAGLQIPDDLSILNCDRPLEITGNTEFPLDTIVFSPRELVRLVCYFLTHRPLMGEDAKFYISLALSLEEFGSVKNIRNERKKE